MIFRADRKLSGVLLPGLKDGELIEFGASMGSLERGIMHDWEKEHPSPFFGVLSLALHGMRKRGRDERR